LARTGPVVQQLGERCGGKRRPTCAKAKRVACEAAKDKRCLRLEPAALPFLTTLGERAVGRSLLAPPAPATATQPVATGREFCKRCGLSAAIPGTPYWAVRVQSLGDLCHMVNQVYDPRSGEFVNLEDGRRAKLPFGDLRASLGDAWISTAGDALIQQGAL